MWMAKGKKTGGRQKGTPNKLGNNVRETIIKVYDMIGGDEAFAAWAKDNRRDYYQLYGKAMPREVTVEGALRLEEIVAGGEDPDSEQ